MVHVAADANAKFLGAGYDVLSARGITFVLQRFGVSITRMPNYDEEVTIRTWPSDISKGTFLRKGDMYDKDGIKIMEWASLWLLFDINARRVLRPNALPATLPKLGDEGVEIMPEKIAVPENMGRPFTQYKHIVSYRDVDTNMHMNNSIYGDLIGDAIFREPAPATAKQDWRQVQINYLAEIRLGEEVEVSAFQETDGFTVIGKAGNCTAFVARISANIV